MSLIPGVLPADSTFGDEGACLSFKHPETLEQILGREAREKDELMEIKFTFDGVPASRTEIERQADEGILPDQYR